MSSKPRIRVFISSPGDVRPERLVAEQVVEKLAREFTYHMRLEAVLWERQPLTADAHFQDNIIPPRQTDIVVVILWSRLGLMLPEERYRGAITGEPVTGTTWEFEDALAGHRQRALPDLLMYRKTAEVQVSLGDREALEQRLAEQDQITAFVDRWFKAGDGQSFSAAFREFAEEAEFQELLEEHLRELLRQHVDATESAAEGIRWHQGSPYRGLESFDLNHAPVFFGRTRARNEVRGLLRRRIARGSAFVLVMGASGSGKSSLVKAGLLHDLRLPGMIGRVALLRHAVITPADGGGDPLRGLAEACFDDAALPELAELNYTVDRLADLLGQSGDQIDLPFVQALDRAAETGRLTERGEARFLLIVDQLEELFTLQSITPEAREHFVERLAALAHSGSVWVVATMRSDFFDRLEKLAPLAALSEGEARYLLAPPSEAEIGQIIRQPAREAGLRFEYDEARGERLDEVLREAAGGNPGALPLLEFLLDQLWRQRRDDGLLTFSAFHDLGGLEGAIGHRAEMVLNAQPAEVQAAFPDLLRRLVTVRADDQATATARAVPLSQFADGSAPRRLLEAFLAPEARLLVAEGGEGDEARVRVAHEALLTHWPRARRTIEADGADIEIRNRLEQAAALWQARGEDESLLLTAGLPLSEAQDLLTRRPDDLPPRARRYVSMSLQRQRQSERRRTRIFGAVAAVLALFAVTAGAAAWIAFGEQEAARKSEAQAQVDRQLAQASAARARLQSELSRIESRNSRAALFVAQERHAEAEAIYTGTAMEAAALGDRGRKLEAMIQVRLAQLFEKTARRREGWQALQRALDILVAAKAEDSLEAAGVLTAMAEFKASHRPEDHVAETFEFAEKLLRQRFGDGHPELIEVQRKRARILAARGRSTEALALLERAEKQYRDLLGTRHRKFLEILRQRLDLSIRDTDDPDDRSMTDLLHYVRIHRDMSEPVPELPRLISDVVGSRSDRKGRVDLIFRLVQQLQLQENNDEITFVASLQSERRPPLRPFIAREETLRRSLGAVDARRDPFLVDAADESLEVIRKRNLEKEQEIRQLVAQLNRNLSDRSTAHPGYVADAFSDPVRFSDLREKIEDGEQLIVYQRVDGRYLILAVDRQGLRHHWTRATADEVDAEIASLLGSLDVSGVATLGDLRLFEEKAAHRVFQELVAPVLQVDTRRLHIIASRPILTLPFSVLLTRDTATKDRPSESPVKQREARSFDWYRTAPWLFRQMEVVKLPALGWLAEHWRTACSRSTDKGVLAVAGPHRPVKSGGGTATRGLERQSIDLAMLRQLPDLPGAVSEAERFVERIDPERSTLIMVDEGSEGRFRAEKPASYGALIFAVHGLIPGDIDGLDWPALAIGYPGGDSDGLLSYPDVLEMRLQSELVVLSASNTFSDQVRIRDLKSDWLGMHAAFMLAGARTVMGTYTSPMEEAAMRVSMALADRLFEGADRDFAGGVRQARLSLLNDKERFFLAHPVIWSPFGLYGNDRGCPKKKG